MNPKTEELDANVEVRDTIERVEADFKDKTNLVQCNFTSREARDKGRTAKYGSSFIRPFKIKIFRFVKFNGTHF